MTLLNIAAKLQKDYTQVFMISVNLRHFVSQRLFDVYFTYESLKEDRLQTF
jgi:hypothetical protein